MGSTTLQRACRVIRKRLQKTLRSDKESEALDQLISNLAVRFLSEKSHRFGRSSPAEESKTTEEEECGTKLKPDPKCLQYLGLTPRREEEPQARPQEKRNGQPQSERTEFQFVKPRVYECNHCSKIFFHKIVHRRHTIGHMRKNHMCFVCNQGFRTKQERRMHKFYCRR